LALCSLHPAAIADDAAAERDRVAFVAGGLNDAV
jgi:hypothetical protein